MLNRNPIYQTSDIKTSWLKSHISISITSMQALKDRLLRLLRLSEKYTKTDMVYLASGTFWGNLNASVVVIITFVASIFFARYFTKEAYGMYQYALAIASLIGATTLTGMNSAITRAVARGAEGEFKRSVIYQLKFGIIPTIIGLVVSGWYFYNGNIELGSAFAWIAIFLPLSYAFNTWAAYVGGKKLFKIGTYYGIANNVTTYIVILTTLYFTRSFVWVIAANFAISFINGFIIYKLITRQIPPNDTRDNESIKYGTHLSAMSIIGVLAGQLDAILVFKFIGSAALAVYSFATIIPERLAGFMKFIPNLAMPKLAERSEEEVRVILKKRLWILVAFVAVIAAIYALIAPWFYKTFFPAYTDAILFTQVYSLSFFSIVAIVLQTALTSQKMLKELYLLNAIMPVVRAGLMTVLIIYYGIWGLLWAQIVTNFISIGIQFVLLRKTARITA